MVTSEQKEPRRRPRAQHCSGMAVLTMLVATSALSIFVSAMVHAADSSVGAQDAGWGIRVQARISEHRQPDDAAQLVYLQAAGAQLPSVDQDLANHCGAVSGIYDSLLDFNLKHWNFEGLAWPTADHDAAQYIYIKNNTLYMKHGADRRGLLPAFFSLLKQLHFKARLPDVKLPFNSGDNPSQILGGNATTPILSFCTRRNYSDILFPNVLEGNVGRRDSSPKYSTHKLERAVWRGTTDASQGWPKGRNALLMLGLERPDLIDSGVSRWNEELMNGTKPDKRLLKESLTFEEQVAMYKYLVWAPGNCASVRLALQLASDALVFKIGSDENEWYYPLLKPFVHYVPLQANSTHVNLEALMLWARQHSDRIESIVSEANKFAEQFLSPRGRDCYALQLIDRLHRVMPGNITLPEHAVNVTTCGPLDHCPEPILYEVEPTNVALLDDQSV